MPFFPRGEWLNLAENVVSTFQSSRFSHHNCPYHPCMVYLPTFTIFYHLKQPNVGKYTIHGWYGLLIHLEGARDKSHRASHRYDLRDGTGQVFLSLGERQMWSAIVESSCVFFKVFFLNYIIGALICMLVSCSFNLHQLNHSEFPVFLLVMMWIMTIRKEHQWHTGHAKCQMFQTDSNCSILEHMIHDHWWTHVFLVTYWDC